MGARFGRRMPRGRVLSALGVAMICCAVALFASNAWIGWRAGVRAHEVLDALPEPAVALDADGIDPAAAMPAVEVDGAPYCGTISIPALDLELPISDACSDAQLAVAPCRVAGSVYGGDLAVAGVDYDAHFGGLEMLLGGEEVVVADTMGNKFPYYVEGIQTLQPMDIEGALRASATDAADGELRLVVCAADLRAQLVVHCVR